MHITNAGIENYARFGALSEADVRSMIETNLIAPKERARRALLRMLARHRGRLIVIASLGG